MSAVTRDKAEAERLVRLASVSSIIVAALLIGFKGVVWAETHSVAILSSLIDSVMDVGASLINFIAIRHALTPPDNEHRFGHGKVEALAGLGQAIFVVGSAAYLVFESLYHLMHLERLHNAREGIAVMVISFSLTLSLVLFQRYVVKKTGSIAIRADRLHYLGDLLTNLGVIAALALAGEFSMYIADPVIALLVAGYILFSAWQILRQSFDHLMDRELPDPVRNEIRTIALSHPGVRAVHDLRTRSSGTGTFIQLNLEMDGNLTLRAAHSITDEVEMKLLSAFPAAEIMVHQEPVGLKRPGSH